MATKKVKAKKEDHKKAGTEELLYRLHRNRWIIARDDAVGTVEGFVVRLKDNSNEMQDGDTYIIYELEVFIPSLRKCLTYDQYELEEGLIGIGPCFEMPKFTDYTTNSDLI